MPVEIQNPKAWAKLVDEFGLTGRHQILIDEVILGVAIVADLTDQEGSGVASAIAQANMTLAGTVGVVGLENVLGSDRDVLIDKIVIQQRLAVVLARLYSINVQGLTGYAADAGASTRRVQWADGRRGEAAPANIVVHSTTGAVTPITSPETIGSIQIPPATLTHEMIRTFTFPEPLILPPGFNCIIRQNAVGAYNAQYYFRVRRAESLVGGILT